MVGRNISRNRIFVDLTDRLISEGGFKKMGEQMQRFEKQGGKTQNLANSMTETFQKDLPRGMQQVTSVTKGTTAAGKDYVKTSTQMSKKNARFNFSSLGVMFAGMALNRAMANLNATSREWVGINELMSTAMGIVTLPATMDLLNLGVLPLFNALTNLPEGAKKAIGLVILGLEGLGAVMMVGGQLALGLESTAAVLTRIGGDGVISGIKKIGTHLKTAGKFAAIGILATIAVKDLTEGEVVAAVGGTAMVAGLIKGGKVGGAVFLIGAGLKILGDKEFQKKLVETALAASDGIKLAFQSLFTLDFERVKENLGIANIFDTVRIKKEQRELKNVLNETEKEISFELDASENIKEFEKSLESLKRSLEFGVISEEDFKSAKEVIDKEKEDFINLFEGATKFLKENPLTPDMDLTTLLDAPAAVDAWSQSLEDGILDNDDYTASIERMNEKIEEFNKVSSLAQGFVNTLAAIGIGLLPSPAAPVGAGLLGVAGLAEMFIPKGIEELDKSKAVGGKVRNTGRFFLHEGEEVIPKSGVGAGEVTVNATYNVNVSDRREFEQLLKASNDKLTADVRRMAKI